MAGVLDVEVMLRRRSAKWFRDWKHYYELEPFGSVSDTYRTAQIVQMLYNINRDTKKDPDGKTIDEFLLWLDRPEEDVKAERQKRAEEALGNKMRVMALIMKAQALAAADMQQAQQAQAPQPEEQVAPPSDQAVAEALAKARAAVK